MSIYIASGKEIPYSFGKNYKVIIVGAKSKEHKNFKFCYDDEGVSISEKNPYYCELTALYWVWKNTNDEIVGLNHYRRFFWLANPNLRCEQKNIMDYRELPDMIDASNVDRILEKYDIILPMKRFYLDGVEKQYQLNNRKTDYDVTRDVVHDLCPEYLPSFENVSLGTGLYVCNMFIMKRRYFNQYMEWLFPILFEVEKRIAIPYDDTYQRRVFGFLAERLLNVFVLYNKLTVKELPMIFVSENYSQDSYIGLKYELQRKFPALSKKIYSSYQIIKSVLR